MFCTTIFTLVTLLVQIFNVSTAAKLPSTFPRCKRSDPDIEQCVIKIMPLVLSELGDNGVPSLGLPALDPIVGLSAEVSQGQGPISVSMKFSNMLVSGLKTTSFQKAHVDLQKYSILVDDLTDTLITEADYEMKGRALLLPITGKGRCKLTFRKMNVTLGPIGREMMKNGKSYFEITEFFTSVHSLELMQVHFDNLFNGDKTLGDNMNQLLNDNWKDLWEELLPPFRELFRSYFLEYTKSMFNRVSMNDLFPE